MLFLRKEVIKILAEKQSKFFLVNLPKDLRDYLKERAQKTHRSVPRYVEMLIYRDIQENEPDTTPKEA